MTIGKTLVTLALLSSVFLVILITGIALLSRYRKYKSLPYLLSSIIFLTEALGILYLVFNAIFGQQITDAFENSLSLFHLTLPFLPLFAIIMYVINIKSPKNTIITSLCIMAPALICSVILYILPEHNIPRSFSYIIANAGRPEVWLRLLICFVYIASPILVGLIPHDWHYCLVPRKLMLILEALFCLLTSAFVVGYFFQSFPIILFHFAVINTFDIYVAYIEFKVRIPVSSSDLETIPNKTDKPFPQEDHYKEIFDNPEIWMNPDMTVVELARIIGTNRTYLTEKIQAMGYSSYPDMINRRRINYICEKLREEPTATITLLMFEAGFRSRSQASREFKRIQGCTPTEYANKLSF